MSVLHYMYTCRTITLPPSSKMLLLRTVLAGSLLSLFSQCLLPPLRPLLLSPLPDEASKGTDEDDPKDVAKEK